MQRKHALVVAGTVAFLGATGMVATAAVTGANILGFHVASSFKTAAAEGATTSTPDTEATGLATTPAPVYVVTTVFYDEFIVVPTPKAAPVAGGDAPADAAYAPAAAPQAAAAYAAPVVPDAAAPAAPAAGPAAGPAPATSDPVPPPPVTPAPLTVRTTTTTSAPAVTPAPATTTTRPAGPATTLFDPNGPVPANFSVPANLKVAASQTPLPPNGPWTKCEFEDNRQWNCEK